MDLPWETDEPWFLYVFLAALAPLLILTIPHSAWKRHVQKNNERIREMELEREKKEREQEISCALESFGKAALTSNLCSEHDIAIAQALHQAARKKAYRKFQDILDATSVAEGYRLGVDECSMEGMGDKSSLYVSRFGAAHDYFVFDGFLSFDDTPSGAWQAYLLHQLKYSLPLWWHANYMKRFFLFTSDDIAYIKHFSEKCDVVLTQTDEDLRPEIYEHEGFYYITCCFWADFGGLKRECARIELRDGHLIECLVFSSEEILPYRAPICF